MYVCVCIVKSTLNFVSYVLNYVRNEASARKGPLYHNFHKSQNIRDVRNGPKYHLLTSLLVEAPLCLSQVFVKFLQLKL